jgi:hypothetical protein
VVDPKVEDLLQGVNRLVLTDLGGRRSLVPRDRLSGMVARSHRRALEPLANNRGLEPGHEQAAAWAALRTAAASYAGFVEPPSGPPPDLQPLPVDQQVFEAAVCGLHSWSATPRLVQGFPDDWASGLGDAPPTALHFDETTASTMVTAIAEQTGQDDQDVLRTLVAAGRGVRGAAAARMLLDTTPGYSTLPEAEQEIAVQFVADDLESGLASPVGDVPPTHPELTGDVDNDPVLRGKVAIAWANHLAAHEVDQLHEALRQEEKAAVLRMPADRPHSRRPVQPPESVYDVIRGIDAEVRELTGAEKSRWSGGFEERGANDDQRIGFGATSFRVRPDDALLLRLTARDAGGPLGREEIAAARQTIKQTIMVCAQQAMPNEYDRQQHVWARAFQPRFEAMERAVLSAFADNELNNIVDRRLPAAVAEQLRTADVDSWFDAASPETPSADADYAPAAQGLADAVHGEDPEALIRRMAGEGLPDRGMAAAEVLVAGSAIPPEHRQAAAWAIGEKLNDGFDALPDRLEEWKSTSVLPAADLSRQYGHELGRMAQDLVHEYATNPDLLQQDVAAAEARTAATIEAQRSGMPEYFMHDPLMPGMDRALSRHRPEAPAAAPAATRAAADGQSGPTGLTR